MTIIIRQVCRTAPPLSLPHWTGPHTFLSTLDWTTHFSQPRCTAPLSTIVHHTGLLRQLPCYTELHRATESYTVLHCATQSYTELQRATQSYRVPILCMIHRQSNTFLRKLYWITQLKESRESNVITKQMHRIFKYNGLVGKNIYNIFACTMCTWLTTIAIVERRC